jgi:predicted transcriptional regulator
MTHLPHQQSNRGVKSGVARLSLSADKREQAIELKAGGMKQVEIAKMLGVNQSTVQRWLKSHQNEQS